MYTIRPWQNEISVRDFFCFWQLEGECMKTFPQYSALEQYRNEGYSCVPLACEILSDFTTPVEVVRILKRISSHVFLLESAKENESWGRWSFLGYDPKLEITCIDGVMQIGDTQIETDDPMKEIRQLLARWKAPRVDGMPPFAGGLAGWFSFDSVRWAEPTIDLPERDEDEFREVDLMLFDKVIAFDRLRQKIILIAMVDLRHIEPSYNKALLTLEQMKLLLRSDQKAIEPAGHLEGEMKPLFDREQWRDMVSKARQHIIDGDIFQIVLANRFCAPYSGSLLNTYRMLRTINPSPYMFYFSGTDVETAGASPETLVRLDQGKLTTFPLAGTRPRGATTEEDLALEAGLLQDEKELAEHDMLVDLGRNDLGRISKYGTVHVDTLHAIERFSHVMHIGSTVSGQIRDDCDALDAVRSVLPAGTLSGAPKIRACQLIGELEGVRRGIYGGAVGYIGFSGDLDLCIAIRLVYLKNGKVFVRSGAGIVADSDPDREFEEVLNKARSSISALQAAQEEDL